MPLETWLAFALASCILLVIPGPTLLLVVSQSLSHGPRVVPAMAVGVMFGDFLAMSVSLIGLGALIAASAEAFAIFKWLAAGYLIYLGVRRILGAQQPPPAPTTRRQAQLMAQAFTVTALNPKSIAFFVAFLPSFIAPAAPLWPQVMIIEATFIGLAGLFALGYGLAAARIRPVLERRASRIWTERLGGGVLVGAGGLVAVLERK
jgi:threonine/homoserine/homoserine lactone efflux protein